MTLLLVLACAIAAPWAAEAYATVNVNAMVTNDDHTYTAAPCPVAIPACVQLQACLAASATAVFCTNGGISGDASTNTLTAYFTVSTYALPAQSCVFGGTDVSVELSVNTMAVYLNSLLNFPSSCIAIPAMIGPICSIMAAVCPLVGN